MRKPSLDQASAGAPQSHDQQRARAEHPPLQEPPPASAQHPKAHPVPPPPSAIQRQAPASQAIQASGWQLGAAQLVYPGAAGRPAPDAGWLILVDASAHPLPQSAAQRPGLECARSVLEGDAARLLDNMLRALRLHEHPRVFSAALQRASTPEQGATGQALGPDLAHMLEELQPACVLILGLAVARAVLGRSDALGRLRAEPHRLGQVPTVVSYDPHYLLRAPQAKAGAWADLCRAHNLVTKSYMPPGTPAD
ncbi:uracil-DNA glycosylase family protein [Comamonas composti]|uniref:uracil-DNA glycosylase family protein n=1 Tax=Comamonas composti TaxID=408558 RepID=UPI00316AC5FB